MTLPAHKDASLRKSNEEHTYTAILYTSDWQPGWGGEFIVGEPVWNPDVSAKAVGLKNLTANEPFFQGHFPTKPIMPGVLMIEAMAQVGGIFALSNVDEPQLYSTYFMKIDGVKFKQKVLPGDTVVFHLTLISPIRRGLVNMKGRAFVRGELVSEAEMLAQIVRDRVPNDSE